MPGLSNTRIPSGVARTVTESKHTSFEASKQRWLGRDGVSAFERYASPQTHPGRNPFRLILQNLRVLGVFLIRRVVMGAGRLAAMEPTGRLAGSAAGRDVLMVGSGPSAASLKASEVAARQRSGSLVVVATNYFLRSSLAKTITPDYLVWSDDVFHPTHPEAGAAWDELATRPSVTVVSPWTWKRDIDARQVKNPVIYFDDDTLEGWSSNISPLFPRGYQGSTGAKALAFGLHLGGAQTFVIGLDLSAFTTFSADSDNRLHRGPAHITGADSGSKDITEYTINGMADLLYSASNEFLHVRRFFGNKGVTNLAADSLVDAFPKALEHPLVKKTRRR